MTAHSPINKVAAAQERRANPLPDLTGLARGTASKIEMLCSHALEKILNKIDATKVLIDNASSSVRYRDSLWGELRTLQGEQEDAYAFQAAAKRIRMSRLTEAERERIDRLRTRNPGVGGSVIDLMIYEDRVDPLDLAGLRLDSAAAEFKRVSASRPLLDDDAEERRFGSAQDAYDAALVEYRRHLSERTGHDADTILRRLG